MEDFRPRRRRRIRARPTCRASSTRAGLARSVPRIHRTFSAPPDSDEVTAGLASRRPATRRRSTRWERRWRWSLGLLSRSELLRCSGPSSEKPRTSDAAACARRSLPAVNLVSRVRAAAEPSRRRAARAGGRRGARRRGDLRASGTQAAPTRPGKAGAACVSEGSVGCDTPRPPCGRSTACARGAPSLERGSGPIATPVV
jgi:hypothetical protein